jgi:hypothetical protein
METEVNEGHPILMAQAYQRGLLKDLTAEEILTVLMGFSEESKRDAPSVDSLDAPRPVIAALWSIYRVGEENQRLEGSARPPRDSYWDINTTWVEPIWRWLGGATVQEAMAAHTPMVITKVVPGQEEGNALLLAEAGAGFVAQSPAAVVEAVRRIFASNGAPYRDCLKAATSLSHPAAAKDIANFVSSLCRRG